MFCSRFVVSTTPSPGVAAQHEGIARVLVVWAGVINEAAEKM